MMGGKGTYTPTSSPPPSLSSRRPPFCRVRRAAILCGRPGRGSARGRKGRGALCARLLLHPLPPARPRAGAQGAERAVRGLVLSGAAARAPPPHQLCIRYIINKALELHLIPIKMRARAKISSYDTLGKGPGLQCHTWRLF